MFITLRLATGGDPEHVQSQIRQRLVQYFFLVQQKDRGSSSGSKIGNKRGDGGTDDCVCFSSASTSETGFRRRFARHQSHTGGKEHPLLSLPEQFHTRVD
jgi:hypothetical protein